MSEGAGGLWGDGGRGWKRASGGEEMGLVRPCDQNKIWLLLLVYIWGDGPRAE